MRSNAINKTKTFVESNAIIYMQRFAAIVNECILKMCNLIKILTALFFQNKKKKLITHLVN